MTNVKIITLVLSFLAMSLPACADSVQTTFGPVELDGAVGTGMYGMAAAEVSLHSTTADGGCIDFALTNTSELIELEEGLYANAFITEFRVDLPEGYTQDDSNSSVIAQIDVRFANGIDNPVEATTIERSLDWDYEDADGASGPLRRAFLSDLGGGSKNVIFSENALDGFGVPVDDYEHGFLGESFDSGVFDTIIFRVKVEGDYPLKESDLAMYECDYLTVKFQGGEGSGRVGNTIPEPATVILIGLGVSALAGIVRRKNF